MLFNLFRRTKRPPLHIQADVEIEPLDSGIFMATSPVFPGFMITGDFQDVIVRFVPELRAFIGDPRSFCITLRVKDDAHGA